jgi:tRNA-guanine family transglycosylase
MARIFVLDTPTRPIEAPVLFPVNNTGHRGEGNGPEYSTEIPDMKTMLLNAHLLHKSSILQTLMDEGLHRHYAQDGVFFIDSGGFQNQASDVTIDPIEILRIQESIGADIAATLDIPVLPQHNTLTQKHAEILRTCVKNALITLQNREREDMLIYACVQGGDIRAMLNMVDHLQKRGQFDGFAIGGLVPKRSDFQQIVDTIWAVRKRIGDAPLHVFGLGGPSYIPLLVYLGVDTFDSSSYLRAGSKRVYFVPGQGSVDFQDIDKCTWLPCVCPVCSAYPCNEVREDRRLIALHNLWMITYEIRKLKIAIRENSLEPYLEQRLKPNPLIYGAYRYAKGKVRGFT